MSAETIIKKNCLPENFLVTAQLLFPSAKLSGVMLEIAELCDLLSDAALRGEWLTDDEWERLSSFKLAKRHDEWLGGRICTKLAAGKLLQLKAQQQYRELVVVNAVDGRPSLQPPESMKKELDISISHSGNLAVAMVADHFCGVDIQKTVDTLLRVRERFCTTSEEDILSSAMNATAGAAELNLLWTAKEAIRKALSFIRVPDFLGLNLSGIKAMSDDYYIFDFSYKNQSIRTLCGAYQNYCLALCLYRGSTDA